MFIKGSCQAAVAGEGDKGSGHDRQRIKNLAFPEMQLSRRKLCLPISEQGPVGESVWWVKAKKMLPDLPPQGPYLGSTGLDLNLSLRSLFGSG